jgi:galactonate dehydratase
VKIARVETTLLHQWLIVEVVTDDGITGIGQSAYWGYPDACERVAVALGELLIGEDPLRRNELWLRMFRSAPFRGGVITSAIASLDIALWDIAGKHFGVPCYTLMGGPVRDRIRLHGVMEAGSDERIAGVDAYLAEAQRYISNGFTAIKFDPLVDGVGGFHTETYSKMLDHAISIVGSVRDAVGWETDIAIEMHRKFGPGEAVDFARELRPFRVYMYEDALPPDSTASWAELAAKVDLPVGAGERTDTIYEFKELLAQGTLQFVRPDVGIAGGLTHCLKIAAIAEAHHAQVLCHNFIGPLLTAATAQLYAAVTNVSTFEYTLLDEEEPRTLLLEEGVRRDGGYLCLPEGPGLGVTLAEGWKERYAPFARWRPSGGARRLDGSLYAR